MRSGSLADAVEAHLETVREALPLTGVVGTFATLISVVFTLCLMVFLSVLLAFAGFLLTQSGIGALAFALGGAVVVGLLRYAPATKTWRRSLQSDGFDVRVLRAGTEVELPVRGDVAITYRFAPRDDVVESLQMRSRPPLPTTLQGTIDRPRLGALTFDGDLGLRGSPAQLACVTAPIRAALGGLDRPVDVRDAILKVALRRDAFDVPADAFDALADALTTLATDLAEPTRALKRISAARGSDAAYFDAARACAVLLADGHEPEAAPAILECVRAALAGDFAPLLTGALPPAQRSAVCRGVFRSGVATEGFAALVFGTRALPDTEAGCLDAIGLLCAIESLAALERLKQLGAIGSLEAARWLSAAQLPEVAGLRSAADAARAAIHQRLHVHGALTVAQEGAGAVSLVEAGGAER